MKFAMFPDRATKKYQIVHTRRPKQTFPEYKLDDYSMPLPALNGFQAFYTSRNGGCFLQRTLILNRSEEKVLRNGL